MKGRIEMNKTLKETAAVLAALSLAMASLTGCADNKSSTAQTIEKQISDEATTAADTTAVSEVSYTPVINTADLFSNRDLEQTADTSSAVNLTVQDGSTLDITEEGVYVISGSASNCTIKVNAAKDTKIQLVLDGVSIENDDFPAIYVVSADKVFITTTEKNSTLAVNNEFKADGDTNTDAVIFSKDDLVLNGKGNLEIYSAYGNGISSKDELKITGGTYKVTSAKDSFEANDGLYIHDGSFEIKTNKDGFHCENSEDDTLGQIYIANGSFGIDAVSDGIQGTTYVQIDGGTFDITSSEGIEATYVQINSGNITISASDDGINASRKSSVCDIVVEINGGELTITMGQGDTDGIDSNGSITVNGGKIDVTAQMSSFDYETTAEFNSGTIIINGEEVDEIPQSMMGGPGGMGGFKGRFGGRPDDVSAPPDGFPDPDSEDGGDFRKHGDFGDRPEGDFPPDGDFPTDGNFPPNGRHGENFQPDVNAEPPEGRGDFKGGGFGENNKPETGGFIERT